MTALLSLPRRVRFRAVTWLSTRAELYYGIRKFTGRNDPQCIRPETDIVIEGYPRSANSTTVYGFLAMQDRPFHVAHHKHHAAQILRAVEWKIPAVVLIRPPREACLSLLALAAEARHRAGKPNADGLAFADVIEAYVAFYEAIEPKLDHIVIGRFEIIRKDLGGLIERVNARFGTNFQTRGGGGGWAKQRFGLARPAQRNSKQDQGGSRSPFRCGTWRLSSSSATSGARRGCSHALQECR